MKRSLSRLAVGGVTAATLVAGTAGPALAGTSDVSPTSAAGGNSATAALLGSLAYRGVEYPYLVGNLADAIAHYGKGSAQANAAAAGLRTNIGALSSLLSLHNSSLKGSLSAALGSRANAEVAYAGGTVVAVAHKTRGENATQKQARSVLATSAGTLAKIIATEVPGENVSDAQRALQALNNGDLLTLNAMAKNAPAFWTDVESGSAKTASLFVTLGGLTSAELGMTGSSVSNGQATISTAAATRATLTTLLVQHVYQTGLFGLAILRTGPRSTQTVAARLAEDINTRALALSFGELGSNGGAFLLKWNTHIAGYGSYLTGLKTGSKADIQAGNAQLLTYEGGITSIIHTVAPSYNVTELRSDIKTHVNGTLQVFDLEKSNSAKVYPAALMGAAHFNSVAASITVAAARAGHALPTS